MVYHSKLWYTMDYHCVPWYTTVHHVIPWYTMIYHGSPWYLIRYHGIPWCTMTWPVYNGAPWYTMVIHGIPWYIILRQCHSTSQSYRGMSWCTHTMVHHTIQWCTTVPLCLRLYYGLPWFTLVYHGAMVYHGNTMVYHGLPWYGMVYHAYTTV